MKAVVLEPAPLKIQEFLTRRKALGQDLYDEIWDGEYHVTPAPAGTSRRPSTTRWPSSWGRWPERSVWWARDRFNLGRQGDFRVPDRGYHRQLPLGRVVRPPRRWWWTSSRPTTRPIVGKLAFYAAHMVDEVLILDPACRRVEWLARRGDGYGPVEAGSLLPITAAELTDQIRWP